MGEDSSPDPYEVYERRVAAFTAAAERVAVAASFLVSRGDDTDDPFHTHINANVRAFARQSFLDADRAAGAVAPRPWLRRRPAEVAGYEARYAPVLTAVAAYHTGMATARYRWGCKAAAFAGEGGPSWVGYVYPQGFPTNADSVRPRELDMLKLVVELLRLHRPAVKDAPPAPAPVEVEIPWDVRAGTKKTVLARLGYSERYWPRARKAQNDGDILLEEVPRGRGRPLWSLMVKDRAMFPEPPGWGLSHNG